MPPQPEELEQALVQVARCLSQTGTQFCISGGAAVFMLCRQHGLAARLTDDIDLVVQPTERIDAEKLSAWLLQNFPSTFAIREIFGVLVPTVQILRRDGTVVSVDVEIFDVRAWPNRPQYDLSNPANEISMVTSAGVDIPVFSPSWLIREKIVTAFERQMGTKAETDHQDVQVLLPLVDINAVDLNAPVYINAVRNLISREPHLEHELSLRVTCSEVLGMSWSYHTAAHIYWRVHDGKVYFLDDLYEPHEFALQAKNGVLAVESEGTKWYYDSSQGDLSEVEPL